MEVGGVMTYGTARPPVKKASIKTAALKDLTPFGRFLRDLYVNRELYLIFIPVLAYYILFHYGPMYGAIIAFKNYRPVQGILGSPWVGLKHFKTFFGSYYFWTLLRNTLTLSITSLLVSFPSEILLALLLNELKSKKFARVVQTVTYMPHFISLVVVCGMVLQFTKSNGFITYLLGFFGFPQQTMLNNPNLFLPVYVISGIWQEIGWGSIIYLAALAGIDQELYEAAEIDGAGRLKKMIYITLPGLLPTITVLFIMRVGKIMSLGSEKVLLLYNPAIYDKADVISTYVYRRGIENTDWSFSAAVGLFNSVINFLLVLSVNELSRKVNQLSLW
jgi:putative aldouronate transport system permease protein